MIRKHTYILDSDVFISAKNTYYAFEICPGFWDSLLYHYEKGNIRSVDRVRGELLAGRKTEDLFLWVKNQLPPAFFMETDEEAVINAYREIMLWVARNPQFFDQAKAKFATEADGWLVAYAIIHGVTVITNEQPRPQARNRILLPDVCTQFNVIYKDTISMLKELGVRYVWKSPV